MQLYKAGSTAWHSHGSDLKQIQQEQEEIPNISVLGLGKPWEAECSLHPHLSLILWKLLPLTSEPGGAGDRGEKKQRKLWNSKSSCHCERTNNNSWIKPKGLYGNLEILVVAWELHHCSPHSFSSGFYLKGSF